MSFRMPKRATTSVATTPILTLGTQMTGLTGKLGLRTGLALQVGVLFCFVLFLSLESHQPKNLRASLNCIVTPPLRGYVP